MLWEYLLKINIEVMKARNIFAVEGEVDSFTISQFVQELELLEKVSGQKIVLDLSSMKSINWRGLLILSNKILEGKERDDEFVLICKNEKIIETLSLFTYPTDLSFFPTLEDLLDS